MAGKKTTPAKGPAVSAPIPEKDAVLAQVPSFRRFLEEQRDVIREQAEVIAPALRLHILREIERALSENEPLAAEALEALSDAEIAALMRINADALAASADQKESIRKQLVGASGIVADNAIAYALALIFGVA